MQTRFSATSFGIRTTAVGSGGFSARLTYGKPELERERLRDLLFGREVHAHEHDAQPFAGALVLGQRGLEIVFGDEARLDQALTDFLAQRAASVG